MEKAEVSIKDTRISEATKNLVFAFNHVTVLMAGANGEERLFLNGMYKELNALRLKFVKFYSKEDREKRVQSKEVEIQENPPHTELGREELEALLKAQMGAELAPVESPEPVTPDELKNLMEERKKVEE